MERHRFGFRQDPVRTDQLTVDLHEALHRNRIAGAGIRPPKLDVYEVSVVREVDRKWTVFAEKGSVVSLAEMRM